MINPTVGIIGKSVLSQTEIATARLLGACLALNGSTIVTSQAPGFNTVIQDAAKECAGAVDVRRTGVFTQTDYGIVYGNPKLVEQLTEAAVLPNPKIMVLNTFSELEDYLEVAVLTLLERGIIVK